VSLNRPSRNRDIITRISSQFRDFQQNANTNQSLISQSRQQQENLDCLSTKNLHENSQVLQHSPNQGNSQKNSRCAHVAGLVSQISPNGFQNLIQVDSSRSINAQINLDSRAPIIVSHKKLNHELSKNLSCHSIKQAIIADGIEKMDTHVKK
jgi:hypothetical protein